MLLGIDVGGTSVKYATCDEKGHLFDKGSFKTHDTLEDMYQAIETIFKERDVDGIALSMPGAVASDEGVIYGASAIDYIHGPNIKKDLEERLQTRVELENDANCAALAEVWLGAAKDNQDCCFVVCGTGIGGAVIKDKKIHKGQHLHGGEFGYMINNFDADSLEFNFWSLDSTVAIVKGVEKELGETYDGRYIFDHANENEVFKKYVNRFYYALAVGIYNIQYSYDPEVIIIGGGISVREDMIDEINKRLDIIIDKVEPARIKPVVKKCAFANDANIIGAIYHYLTISK